jgi:putative nucleotidyltransferase with HDIG domain
VKAPVSFLSSLAQVFAAMRLYKPGHPARSRALDSAFQHLQDLQDANPAAEFTFLSGEVLCGEEPLWELKEWEWAKRLAEAGVQRLSFTGPVTHEDLEHFVEDVANRMEEGHVPTAEARPTRPTAIKYGAVHLKGDDDGGGDGAATEPVATATLGFTLREEAETVRCLHDELKSAETLHLLEAEAIVRSLSVAMHGDQQFLIPLIRLKEFDQYTTTHALNVSILAMALAEFIGLAPREVRAFGISGLLHDVGKTRVPEEILNKAGKLTDEERLIINSHTVEGARLIMETDQQLDLAAVVAYEHHIRIDGGGYPALAYPRPCHQCSNLVHVCDVYDALRTKRPYRDAWEHSRVIGYIEEGTGSEFEKELGTAFVEMMATWEQRVAVVHDEDEALPIQGLEGTEGRADRAKPAAAERESKGPEPINRQTPGTAPPTSGGRA